MEYLHRCFVAHPHHGSGTKYRSVTECRLAGQLIYVIDGQKLFIAFFWLYTVMTSYRYRRSPKHYENMSMQYTAIFHGCKNVHFQMKCFNIFLIFAQNIDCGYMLEPPQ